jgi:hypothetical protein
MEIRFGFRKMRIAWKALRPEEYVNVGPCNISERIDSKRVVFGAVYLE